MHSLTEAPISKPLILNSDMETENQNTGIRRYSDSDISAKSFTVLGFLRNVFAQELANDNGRDHKLVVAAVHAAFLESGFVAFDRDSNAITDGILLYRDAWPSRVFALSLFYTLPESASQARESATVVLKFQVLGKFLNVYGSLGGGVVGKRGKTCSVRLNEDELVPFLNVVWADCRDRDYFSDYTSSDKEVLKFWRSVKDNLALPLLIDICDNAGLPLPPCFTRLPTELKRKILELLPGVELAKVSCLSSELRYLASNDDLWKLKFSNEFGYGYVEVQGSWKKAFERALMLKSKSRKRFSAINLEFDQLKSAPPLGYDFLTGEPHNPAYIPQSGLNKRLQNATYNNFFCYKP